MKQDSGFLLCMLSPVWRAKLCLDTKVWKTEESRRCLELEPDDEKVFDELIDLGCGIPVQITKGLKHLMHIGKVADKYGMDEVLATVEEEALKMLNIDTCGELLTEASEAGLRTVEEQSKALAVEAFEAFARTDGFLRLGEGALESLLADDLLFAGSEAAVLAAAARWMTAPSQPERHPGSVRGEGLLQHIRFPLMDGEFLSRRALESVPGSAVLQALVGQTLAAKARLEAKAQLSDGGSEAGSGPKLGDRAHVPRGLDCVAWLKNGVGDARRLVRAAEQVFSVAGSGRRLVCGLWSGDLQAHDRQSGAEERRLLGHTRVVAAVVRWARWVVSGSSDGQIRAWDPETGACEAVLSGHAKGLSGLAVCGARLLSASDDGTVRVWGLRGPPAEWRWERSLAAGAAGVRCLAAGGGRAVAGGADGVIRVWNTQTWALERVVEGHGRAVLAVAVSGSLLVSSGEDGAIRAWSLTTGACRGAAAAGWGAGPSRELVRCLAVTGSQVVGGTQLGRMCVWDRTSLGLLHSGEVAGRAAVRMLVVDGRSLLGCVGQEVLLLAQV